MVVAPVTVRLSPMVTFLVELLMVLCRSEMLVTTRLSLMVTFPVELLIAPCGSEVPPTVRRFPPKAVSHTSHQSDQDIPKVQASRRQKAANVIPRMLDR